MSLPLFLIMKDEGEVWSMDKPVERIRVLGTSPETDQGDVRKVLDKNGEIWTARRASFQRSCQAALMESGQ
jgi:hypothetical protein